MLQPPTVCDVPGCASGSCWSPARFYLAGAAEVPPGCPNRVVVSDPATQLAAILADPTLHTTPRAAEALSGTRGATQLARLRQLVSAGRLVVLEARAARATGASGPAQTRGEEEGDSEDAAEAETEKTWIKLKVVDDAAGSPIAGVVLHVRIPSGTESEYTARPDGVVEINEIAPGTCAARCDLEGARLEDTLSFVTTGEQPSGSSSGGTGDGASSDSSDAPTTTTDSPTSSGTTPTSGTRIANIEKHRVQTGESLESLATGAGMTWQQLCEFNFGTAVPAEVNNRLRDDVGCTQRTADGNNYVFTSDDDPGIIYIPTLWQQDGLATEQEHVFRVSGISPATQKPQTLTVCVPIDDIFTDAVDDDEATLESADGAYKRKLQVAKDGKKEDEEYIQLMFKDVIPGKKYKLTYDTKEDADQAEVALVVMLDRVIKKQDCETPLRLDVPFEDLEDEGTAGA